ncbi:cation:dicarboxylate symporter family transporter [Oribacterium sp. NK2B42]|uniref:cation:dicarboxylate symporter family transporter n=1 Tax=Oribacterium sp. NK2B42 TaxID=689781 RepID=UPI00041A6464|nr:cation:dicarboxylase symporter family transporter [Oribacterium sp. NK2B42]
MNPWYVLKKTVIDTTPEAIAEGMDAIREMLNGCGLKPADINKAELVAEETLSEMAAHADQDAKITLSIRMFLETVTMEIRCNGQEFRFAPAESDFSWSGYDPEGSTEEDMMQRLHGIIAYSFAEEVKYKHTGGCNFVKLVAVRSKRSFLYHTVGAMFLAILVGMLLSSVNMEGFNSLLNTYLLVPVKTMYMNALKAVVAPVVFFSIVSCIVRFSDLSELGRVGGRIILMYLFTTLIAVAVGFSVFYLFQPGNPMNALGIVDVSSITSKSMDVSIKDVVVGIVPSNFVKPFLESNMLQLIFLAVVCGIATGMIGKYSDMVKDLFEAGNDLFLKITTIIIGFMPFAVFCSITSMMITTGVKTIISVLGMLGTFLFGLVCMMTIYCLLILVIGRVNPLHFVQKYVPTMLQVFSMASSNASIPVNMDACENLGISKKIYSLSIPLGATLNMDGTCIYLGVFALALAKTYGIPVTGATLFSMSISIIVLSMGAPGVAGAGLICLSVLLEQMGVPLEAIGLVMGIDSLVGMFRTMSNCLGDVAVSTIVAKQEDALDMEKYNDKKSSRNEHDKQLSMAH